MPNTENSDSTAGRVTRSLRKRLTSIDSETSSRPGTPVLSNLLTIQETVTPSKRVTRRTSISTPLVTPSKLKGRPENVDSPARRSTRRRSVSILEEDHAIATKSKEPSVIAVQEETPKVKNRRVTRSSSKSPLETNSSAGMSTPKVDIIILDDSVETSSITSPASNNKKQTKVLIKKEKTIDQMAFESSPTESLPKTSSQKKRKDKAGNVDSTPSAAPKGEKSSQDNSKIKSRMTFEESSPAKAQTPKGSSKKSDNLESNTKLETSQNDANKKNRSSGVSLNSEKATSSPQNKKNLSSSNIEPVDYPQEKKTRPEKLKNVVFNETAEENAIKSVFPKTPGLIKSKSYILDSSKEDDKETSTLMTENLDESKKSDKDDIDEEELNTKTPYKLKLKALESSTPIQSNSPDRNKTTGVEQQTQDSPKKQEDDSPPLFPKSWTQSVSGKVSDKVKIDSIESEEKLRKKLEEEEALKKAQLLSPQNQRKRNTLDDSDDDDVDMLEEDDIDEFNEDLDSSEEECDREKTVFLDDEAMEVPDGEESMDSEERAYLEENEVPVYGESIGSQDSEDGDFEEEGDEEDDAFIVSDSEDVRAIIESDSDDGAKKKEKGRKYKRIMKRMSESSNEDTEKKTREQNLSNDQEESGGTSKRKSLKNKEDESVPNGITKDIDKAGEEEKKDDDSESENMTQSKKERKSPKKTFVNRRMADDDDSNLEAKEDDDLNISKSSKLLNKSNPDNVSKVDSPNKRKSQHQQEDEINVCESSKADTPSNSKSIADEANTTINDETENRRTPKKERKSLNSSKHDRTVLEDGSHDEKEEGAKKQSKSPKESRKSLSKVDGSDKSEIDDNSRSYPDHASATKSPKKPSVCEDAKSPATDSKRKSINQFAQEDFIVNTPLPKIESRKSLKKDPNTSKSTKSFSESNADSDQEEFIDLPTKDKNQSMKQARNSVDNTDSEKAELSPQKENLNTSSKKKSRKSLKGDQNTSQSAKSMNKSKADSDQEEENKNQSLKQARNSVDNTDSEKAELSPQKEKLTTSSKKNSRKSLQEDQNTSQSAKSMNKRKSDSDQEEFIELPIKDKNQSLKQARNSVSNTNSDEAQHSPGKERKSLTSNGANEEMHQQSLHSRSLNKSKLEKTVLSFEGSSEPEDTLSSTEIPSRISGGSLNSSRKSRKSSLNQSKMSLPSDDELDMEDTKLKKHHRKSESQNMVLRVDSTPEVSASEEEKYGDDEANELRFSETDAEEQHHKSLPRRSTMLEFLGEEDNTTQQPTSVTVNSPRRKSSLSKSKLDETFEMEIGNSFSMRDNLHRSIMRKSMNQSQVHKQMEPVEDEVDDFDHSSAEEEVKVDKKVPSKQGLSVSLSNIELKKKKLKGGEQNIHNSFTIGVTVRTPTRPLSDKASSAESVESDSDNVLSEQEDLEKIQHVHRVGPYNSRRSLSTSLKVRSEDPDDAKQKKLIKRTSLYLKDDTASQSFVDNIAEEKEKIESKRKRKSIGFCEVDALSDKHDEEEPAVEEKPSLKSGDKSNIKHILSRCDEILEAANRAKLDAKLNAKKSKVKKPKWMDKQKKTHQAEDEVTIPLVSRKELKRKEKIKKELAKAIKHSTVMLMTIDPKLGKKLNVAAKEIEPKETDDDTVASKRLPTEFLRTLEGVPELEKKKSKISTSPSDKENSKKSNNKDTVTRDVSIEKKKKKPNREMFKTTTGTFVVEPSTPIKLRCQNGFRESPKTPVGFKIESINSAGQNKNEKTRKRAKMLLSEKFVGDDLSKANVKRDKTRKRKRHIEELSYSLPKTQWTSSGVFVEEDIYNARPLANSTATQFMVSSLNGNKKNKNPTQAVSTTTLDSALSFKQKALFGSKAQRETARELIHRKQRKIINNKF